MKINVGNMFKILQQLFKDRISHDYIKKDHDEFNNISSYYLTYINLLKNKKENENNNIILFNAYDIFPFMNYITNNFNKKEYDILRSAHIYYNYYKKKMINQKILTKLKLYFYTFGDLKCRFLRIY